jgi:hypothetical protein
VSDDAERADEQGGRKTAREQRYQRLKSLLFTKIAVRPVEATEDHILSILAIRRGREATLGRELFSDPAWDMLLELYAASLGKRRMTLADLARSIDVPESTIARRVTLLADRGLVSSSVDTDEAALLWIDLNSAGASAMKRLIDYWESAFRSI